MRNFCCAKMGKEQKEIGDKNLKDHSVVYNKRYREFRIYFNEEVEQRDREMITEIHWCPWCGAKLPKELWDEWYDILEKEYTIIDPNHTERSKVPLEFLSDKWWKKRGL